MTKKCGRCKEELPLTSFYLFKTGKYSSYCKKCKVVYNSENDKKFPDRVAKARRKTKLKANYGITEEEFNRQFEYQYGSCAICDVKLEDTHIDHCHDTGELRGILCPACNKGLGHFKDNLQILLNAVEYIRTNGIWKVKGEV